MTIFQPDSYTFDSQAGVAPHVGCHISLQRVILMSVVTMGLYWFYWMYRTWKQFRDHTGAIAYPTPLPGENGEPVMWWYHARNGSVAYPVWHGLTQLVPIYGFFRFYAHIREYKALVQGSGVYDSLNLGLLTAVVVINTIAGLVGGAMRDPNPTRGGDSVDGGVILIGITISIISLVATIIVLCWIQSNLNRYWVAVDSRLAQPARFGKGEILLIVLGILFWLGSVADIIWPT